jgi:Ca-activated chloride channel family protein
VRLRYDDLAESKPGNCEGQLATRLSTDASALTPLDALVSGRLSATETAQTLETANELFRAGRAEDARGLLSRQQAKVASTRRTAAASAPAERRKDVDKAFDSSEAVGGADDVLATKRPPLAGC